MRTHDDLRKSGMQYVDCSTCQGRGTIISNMHAQNCSKCLGDGKIWQKKSEECKFCEFEHGWEYPFCRSCGKIFDPVPLLERVKDYVASVNDDYAEDEERDQTVLMIADLIKYTQTQKESNLQGNDHGFKNS